MSYSDWPTLRVNGPIYMVLIRAANEQESSPRDLEYDIDMHVQLQRAWVRVGVCYSCFYKTWNRERSQ